MRSSIDREGYSIAPANRFVGAIRGMAEFEIRPGITVTLINEIDCTSMNAIRDQPDTPRPSYTAFVVKALAMTLAEYPYANCRLQRFLNLPFFPHRMQCFRDIDVMVAVEREIEGAPSAVFADVLRNADRLSLFAINDWLRDLAQSTPETNEQWRDFRWAIEHLPGPLAKFIFRLPYRFPSLWVKWRGGAAMVSSPAKYGVDGIVGSWTAPLGVSFGFVRNRPIAAGDTVRVAPTMNLVLNFDRTVMAGAQASKFFKRFSDRLCRAEQELV